MRPKNKKAVILLSGGLDSATVLYHAKKQGYTCHCLLFLYGQRHEKELLAARRIAKQAGCPVTVVSIALPWGGSSLIDKKAKIPVNKNIPAPNSKFSTPGCLPSTYVPGRNTVFISFALSFAETLGAQDIFIGANAIDFSGYPDCRPKYFKAWNALLRSLGVKIKVQVPLVNLTKAQIIRKGVLLGVPYQYTWSCYKGGEKPCGICDSCRFRSKGFQEAGIKDPAGKRVSK